MTSLEQVWNMVSNSPVFGIGLTMACYQFGCDVHRRAAAHPLCNPVLLAVVAIVGLLLLTGTTYQTYARSASWLGFLLGPATVGLAVPLYKALGEVRRAPLAVAAAVSAGAITASVSAMAVAWMFGASPAVIRSLAAKSVTTPVAIGVSSQIGGIPDLTAVIAVSTGIIGGLCAPEIAALAGIRCWRARGLAAGVAGHGIATARMLSMNGVAGAFAGLAMGLCSLITAVMLPLFMHSAVGQVRVAGRSARRLV